MTYAVKQTTTSLDRRSTPAALWMTLGPNCRPTRRRSDHEQKPFLIIWAVGLSIALLVLSNSCGYGDDQSTEGPTSSPTQGPAPSTTDSSIPPGEPTSVPTTEHVQVQVSGPAVYERPAGEVIVQGGWGNKDGQFGLGEGTPVEGPLYLGVSPTGDLIAIYDWANDRIQVVDDTGKLVRVIPLGDQRYIAISISWQVGRSCSSAQVQSRPSSPSHPRATRPVRMSSIPRSSLRA